MLLPFSFCFKNAIITCSFVRVFPLCLSQEADEADRERAAAERALAQCHTRLRRRADDAAFVRALNEQLLASASHAQDAIERVRQQGERRAREAPAVRAKERQIAELERRVAEAMGAFQSE